MKDDRATREPRGDVARPPSAVKVTRSIQQAFSLFELGAHSPRTEAFRPIQYLGSKMKLLPDIVDALADVTVQKSGAICDLFSGSGVVAHALAAQAPVLAVDIQEYARVLASGILTGGLSRPGIIDEVVGVARSGAILASLLDTLQPIIALESECLREAQAGNPTRLHDLIDGASLARHAAGSKLASPWLARVLAGTAAGLRRLPAAMRTHTLVTRLYGGSYFSFKQAAALDALRAAIVATCSAVERDLGLGALLSAASAAVNTVGKQFAQPIRLQKKDGSFRPVLVEHTLHDRSMDVFATYADWGARWLRAASQTTGHEHRVVRADYAEFLWSSTDQVRAFYADPPYTIDHYSRFYHVLETLCLYDEPDLATMKRGGVLSIMRGLYRAERHQSPFCVPSTAIHAFDALFDGVKRFDAPLVLSYSPHRNDGAQRPRLLDLPTLVRMARQRFARVKIVPVREHTHRKLNADANNVAGLSDSEVLLVCGN